MIKIDLNFDLKNLDGTEIGNAGKVVGQFMVLETSGDALKIYKIASKLYNREEIEVDREDFDFIKNWISNTTAMTVLAKGQVLAYLEEVSRNFGV